MEELTPKRLIAKYENANLSAETTVLTGLEAVDWTKFDYSFAESNEDIPALLRAALSQDQDDRDFAFQLLHETIWHQGTIYEASSHVVPFLLAMLLSPVTPDKRSVAELLTSLVDGNSENEKWVLETRIAIGNGIHLIFQYLEDENEIIRCSVAKTLRYYPEYADRTIPLLEKALRSENDIYCREEIGNSIQILLLESNHLKSA